MAVVAAQMLDAQLEARCDPLRRWPLLHGLGRRPGVFLDTLPFLHFAAQGDGRRSDIFPGAGLSQKRKAAFARNRVQARPI